MSYTSEVRIRKPAPGFSATALVNGEFKKVSLSDYKGKWVYLFFYPLGMYLRLFLLMFLAWIITMWYGVLMPF